MDSAIKIAERFPWFDAIEDIAEQQGFFHWELQFAQIFNKGGFDLQVGNPPWVRPDWQENSVLAELEPWFMLTDKPALAEWRNRKAVSLQTGAARSYYLNEFAANVGIAEFLSANVTYALLGGTRPDLYRAFMCRVWTNLSSLGTAGLIHPDTHFGGRREGPLRAASYRHLRLHASFVNAANWAFEDLSRTQEFGLHIYGSGGEIRFAHLSELYGAQVVLESLVHGGMVQYLESSMKENGMFALTRRELSL
ncbi:Eco57I restriction-modification methylase domain-containing protein [Streptosporangium lutulentum]